MYLYLCWQNLEINFIKLAFQGNRRSGDQDAQSHPKKSRLIVSVLRVLWCCVRSCESRKKAFPSAGPPLNWLLCQVHFVYWHDRGYLVFPSHPFTINAPQWPPISSRLFIIFSRSLNPVTSYIKALLRFSAVCLHGRSLSSVGGNFQGKIFTFPSFVCVCNL